MTPIFYFGCWEPRADGHYLYSPNGQKERDPYGGPWEAWCEMDGCPQPTSVYNERRECYTHTAEPLGVGRIIHKDGWTSYGFWDRTADKRPASNSAFVAKGTFTAVEMAHLAAEHFPRIWARMRSAFPSCPECRSTSPFDHKMSCGTSQGPVGDGVVYE